MGRHHNCPFKERLRGDPFNSQIYYLACGIKCVHYDIFMHIKSCAVGEPMYLVPYMAFKPVTATTWSIGAY